MATVGDLVVNMTARNQQFVGAMAQSQSALSKFSGMVKSAAAAIAPMAGMAGFGAMTAGAVQLESKMRQSTAIMLNLSDAMRGRMQEAALEVGRTTKFAASEAAEAFYFLSSAGLSAEQSIAALPAVATFAQAGMFDFARATELAMDSQSAIGMRSKDAAVNLENLKRVTDVLVKANVLANASTEQFGVALQSGAGAAAKLVGKDIEEVVAVLATLADQGTKAEEAGTAVNIVFRDLQTKAIENAAAFRTFNVSVFDSSGDMRNMADIVGDLERALAGMSDEQKKTTLMTMGFSDKSMLATAKLLGTSEKIREYETALRSAGGYTKEVANNQMGAMGLALAQLKTAATEAGLGIIETLKPALVGSAQSFTQILVAVTPIVPMILKFGIALLSARAAIFAINLAMKAYIAYQKASTMASALALALSGPAGMLKMATGVAAAGLAMAALNGSFSNMDQEVRKANTATTQATKSVQTLVAETPKVEAIAASFDKMAEAMQKTGKAAVSKDAAGALFDQLKAFESGMEKFGRQAKVSALAFGPRGMRQSDFIDIDAITAALAPFQNAGGKIGQTIQDINAFAKEAEAATDELQKRSSAVAAGAKHDIFFSMAQERVVAATENQRGAIARLRQEVARGVSVFGTLKNAMTAAKNGLESLESPADKLAERQKEIETLGKLFPQMIGEAEKAKLGAKAMEEFDNAIGGPAKQIEELTAKLAVMREGLGEGELALRKLAGTPGVSPEQVAEIRRLQGEMDRMEEASKMTQAGKEMAARFASPLDKFKDEVLKIRELMAGEFISPNVAEKALREAEKQFADAQPAGNDKPFAGAIEQGSAEAWSTILGAMGRGDNEAQKKAAIDTAKNTAFIADFYRSIRGGKNAGEGIDIEDMI